MHEKISAKNYQIQQPSSLPHPCAGVYDYIETGRSILQVKHNPGFGINSGLIFVPSSL